jgi:hypothetical protein
VILDPIVRTMRQPPANVPSFEALGNWEGFLMLAAASAIATALLWVAMPETRPAQYLD